MALAILALVMPTSLGANGVLNLTGELDYDPIANAEVVETITGNVVALEFPLEGGPFSGSAQLDLAHVVHGTCQFTSAHAWTFSGIYDAVQQTFSGTYVETLQQTEGACEGVTFSRTFEPDEGPFQASIVAQIGRLRSQIRPLAFTMMVDPALFGGGSADASPPSSSTAPETTPPETTSPETTPPETTAPTGGGSDSGDAAADLAGPALAFLALLLALAAAFGWRQLRRGGAPAGAPSEPGDEAKGPCDEFERRWRAAQDRCDEAQRRATELSDRFDSLESELKQAQRERDQVPSEETRVELPDGTSLSQLDLELRRAAARDAWDAYMADPNPASADAAEDAWRQQATPEWLAEQRRAHEARRAALDERVERARGDLDQVGRDLARARTEQQDACDQEMLDELRRQLDECLRLAAAPPAPPAEPTPTLAPPVEEPTPPKDVEPPAGGGPVPPAPTPREPGNGKERPCPEGAEQWQPFDGPHPFEVLADPLIRITNVVVIAGTSRRRRLGSLDASEMTLNGQSGEAVGIDGSYVAAFTPNEIRSLFSGPGGLAETWGTAGAGAVQQMTLTLEYSVRRVQAYCDRKEVCVNGRWESRAEWRSRLTGPIETRTADVTVSGNIEAGLGRTEDDYIAEIVAFFAPIQSHVRALREAAQTLDQYQRDCKAGRRAG